MKINHWEKLFPIFELKNFLHIKSAPADPRIAARITSREEKLFETKRSTICIKRRNNILEISRVTESVT